MGNGLKGQDDFSIEKLPEGHHDKKNNDGNEQENPYSIPEQVRRLGMMIGQISIHQGPHQQNAFNDQNAPKNPF